MAIDYTRPGGEDPFHAAVMPGGGISRRPLHVIIAADVSGSMIGEKIQSLNYAIAVMLPHLERWEQEQELAQVFLRVVTFGSEATWHIEEPVPVAQVRWKPLTVKQGAFTSTGAALRLMASVLTAEQLDRRALQPALILVTDGMPTDAFDAGLAELMATAGGRSAIRLAIAIGRDPETEPLERFIGDPAVQVLVAKDAEEITDLLVAVSIAVSRMSQAGADRGNIAQNVFSIPEEPIV